MSSDKTQGAVRTDARDDPVVAGATSAARKAFRRLIPFLFACYVVSFLDRVNIGFAALQMNADLGLTATAFGWASGIFFIGYVLFEVPSNVILQRVGARVWIARIMITWGIFATALAAAGGLTALLVLRFLLGVAEAGFVAGIFLFLTYWFPARQRGRAFAWFLLAAPVAVVIGSPVSAAVLTGMDGLWGLAGWRWLFLVEGLPAVLLGVAALFVLSDGPARASWLGDRERADLVRVLDRERARSERAHELSLRRSLTDRRVLVLGAANFLALVGLFGLGFWLPQIVRRFGGLSVLEVGLVTAVPYAVGAVAMILWARHSDRTGERVGHIVASLVLAGVGFGASALVDAPVWSMIALSVAAVGIFANLATFWTLPPMFLAGGAAAGGLAMIVSIGNLGGFVGPYLIGVVRDATGGFTPALVALAVTQLLAAVIVLGVGRHRSLRGAGTGGA